MTDRSSNFGGVCRADKPLTMFRGAGSDRTPGYVTGGTKVTQYVWGGGATYINELVSRDVITAASGTGYKGWTSPASVSRVYAQQDANMDVTSVTGPVATTTSGTTTYSFNVTSRFVYDPYGSKTTLSGSWTAASGTQTGGAGFDLAVGFQGGYQDAQTGKIMFQHRDLDPVSGRWMTEDMKVYVDGMDRYQFALSSPTEWVDWNGMNVDPRPSTRPSLPPLDLPPSPVLGEIQKLITLDPPGSIVPPHTKPLGPGHSVKIVYGYARTGFWSTFPSHTYLLIDGVGYGMYANSHHGGPHDSCCGCGVVYTSGCVVSGDETAYPPVEDLSDLPWDAETFGLEEDALALFPGCKLDFEGLMTDVQSQVGRRNLTYVPGIYDCRDWVMSLIERNVRETDELAEAERHMRLMAH